MIVTELCEKLKVVSFEISIMKNIGTTVYFKSFPIKLIYYGSFNLVCLLKSIAINLYFFF